MTAIERGASPARVSVVVPVLDEARALTDCLDSLEALGPDEIVVVDGGSSDGTAALARERLGRVERTAPGRARQLNHGARVSTGDILLFVHADVRLPADALPAVRAALDLPGVVAGAFDVQVDAPGVAYAIISWAANLRAHRTRIPYGDQALFVRRRTFDELGGFPELIALEDVAFSQRLKRRGEILYLGHRVRTSPRRWEREGLIYATVRNWAVALAFVAGIPAERLAPWYPKIR